MNYQEILNFWFSDESRTKWFDSDPEYDLKLKRNFCATWEHARDGNLSYWESASSGALALIMALDQFPLNMFRGQSLCYSTTHMALDVAKRAVTKKYDKNMTDEQKTFMYMPYMHSEDINDQDISVTLFSGIDDQRSWALHHQDIVKKFGRFPHRNALLNRKNTVDEEAWLCESEAYKG